MNPGFEEGEGPDISGWLAPEAVQRLGYRAEISAAQPFAGEHCARLWYAGEGEPQPFGTLTQMVDASAWRGKAFRFRAAVRVEGLDSRAQLWFRVDRPGGARGFFDNMHDRPITSSQWSLYQIQGEVAPDAERLVFGLLLAGGGEAFVDAVELEPIEVAPPEPARPLEDRGLANLVAFARLLGYVRHFHPSDEAAEADWAQIAAAGVRAVERAQDPAQLAAELEKLLAPVAPTVQVHGAGEAPEKPAALRAPDPGDGFSVTSWRHYGFGTSTGQLYRSWREKESLRGGHPPDGFRDPAQTLEADLGAGVSASIPLALYADEEGTLPHISQHGEASAVALLVPLPSGDDRATRLADVILLWNVFQHFYPYFDVVGTDWAAELDRALRSAAEDPSARDFLGTLERLVAALHDGHGAVRHSSDERFYWPPLCWDWVEGELVITQVLAGTGQQEASSGESVPPVLERGSVVLSIDGIPTAEAFRQACLSISGATPQYIRREALWLAAGPKDSGVTLGLRTPEGEEREIVCLRSMPGDELAEPRPEPVAELEPGILYIDIDRVSDADFEAALPRLEQAHGIVFDLRGYPMSTRTVLAHLIDEPIQCARWCIPIVTLPDREAWSFDESLRWWIEPQEPRLHAKTAFLTDGRAVSAAETVLGMVEHYRLAEIVGGPTAGTNGNICSITLPGGYHVTWTGMKVLKHDGSQHHGVGIQPTVPCSRTIAGVTAGRDEVLERGLDVVRD